jgi:NDP-sugar pyrophosphorylase family protein
LLYDESKVLLKPKTSREKLGDIFRRGYLQSRPELKLDDIRIKFKTYTCDERYKHLIDQILFVFKQLCSYKHYGYWQSMDTLRDKMELDKMWRRNKAPWKIWKK